jgi:deoxyribonuclease V
LGSEIPQQWLYPADWEAAAQVQRQMATQVILGDQLNPIRYVAGTDVSNTPRDPENRIYAAMVSLAFPSLKRQESTCVLAQSHMAYQPGFLAFRESPALIQAFQQLSIRPDCLLVDGHGISHPRGLGIASHLGVLLDCPSIGVAKSILVGRPQGELGNQTGDTVPLRWKDKTIGYVLRTRPHVQPVYVSIGHRVSLETALQTVLQCLTRYRLPEPTRLAHQAANACRTGQENQSMQTSLWGQDEVMSKPD